MVVHIRHFYHRSRRKRAVEALQNEALAAVANAVGDALAHLGISVTSTPLGPNDIHALLVAAGHA